VRFDDIVSNETRASTDNSWGFFSEDIVHSNIVLVRLIGEDDLTGDTSVNSPVIILVLDETKVLPQPELPSQEVVAEAKIQLNTEDIILDEELKVP